MSRFPRSLIFYVAASSLYAALVFIAVHAVYGFELGRAGVSLPPSQGLLGSVDTVSFAVWLGISLIAGTILYRLAKALDQARDTNLQRQSEVGSIFAIGQALSGSHKGRRPSADAARPRHRRACGVAGDRGRGRGV